MLKKLALLSVSAASAFALHNAEININNKDLEVAAQLDIGQFNRNVKPDTLFVGARFLNADEEHSDDDRADLNPLLEANLLKIEELTRGLRLGLGVKGIWTKNYAAIPLGVEGKYTLDTRDYVPFHFNVGIYYAPQVLALRDADSYLEARFSVDVEIIQNGNITLGYRTIETNYENEADFTYNRSAFIGFKLNF